MFELSFYEGKSVFVTGHTGFKGTWLCKMLVQAGARVTGYALQAPTEPSLYDLSEIQDEITSIIGDIRDFDTLKKAAGPEDLAGLAEVPLTVGEAVQQGVPVPFPATAEETHLCDNKKGKTELGMTYTGFEEGMGRTYRAFRNVYVQ